MTWLWRIFFSGLALSSLWGVDVSGSVMLADSRDPAVRKHKDFSGVVVWLEPTVPAQLADQAKSGPPPHAKMVQKD